MSEISLLNEKVLLKLKENKYNEAWDLVKYIGIDNVHDMRERYLVFLRAVSNFDVTVTNKFIPFYLRYLKLGDIERDTQIVLNQKARTHVLNSESAPKGKTTPYIRAMKRIKW